MRNQLPAHQTPKNERREIKRGGCSEYYLTDPRYNYTPYSDCPTQVTNKGAFQQSGEIDERVCWRCPDCGVERAPTSDAWECCSRCGSTQQPELR